MLFKKDLEELSDGNVFETVALIKGYDVKPTKTGGKFIGGCVEIQGTVDFKVWSGNKLFENMLQYDYSDTVCHIVGKVNDYNGTRSLILTDVKALEEGTYDKSYFFEDKYDTERYWVALCSLINKNCSQDGIDIFNKVMSDEELSSFKTEFAARSHHDAVKSGLLAHTYKVTYIMTKIIKLYTSICSVIDTDEVILGCALHDIGKVKEYTNGLVKGNGLLVSHHTFGVEILAKYKDFIIDRKSEEFYYRLLSVVEQHHGEFGETPRTIDAFLVHLADNIEAKFQVIEETFEKDIHSVSLDDFKLN